MFTVTINITGLSVQPCIYIVITSCDYISSIFKVLYYVLEAFALLKHLCLCLCLDTFPSVEEVLQAFDPSACPMLDPILIVYTNY